MLRIGYQGDVGSNAEAASNEFVVRRDMREVELVPLIGSQAVVEALAAHRVDLGVVACRNSIAGLVNETHAAVAQGRVERLDEVSIPIHHCMFVHPEASRTGLETVASHVQALMQTRRTRARLYPQLAELEVPDTAIAARWLCDGRLPRSAAVLCRRNAGELYGLSLVRENLEDEPGNHTDFMLLR